MPDDPAPVLEDVHLAAAMADVYERVARLRAELEPFGVAVTVSVSIVIGTPSDA